MKSSEDQPLSVFLCGDLMSGRGIDQALPHPGSPVLHESHCRDAREYVRLAERVSGPITGPLGFGHIWGDALAELNHAAVDASIINLETSITHSDEYWPGKAIHYRMNPPNIGCLTAAGIRACSLANNHVLDWGRGGLTETLQTLDEAGLAHAGAGRDAEDAAAPAVLKATNKGSVCLFAFGSTTSGIPREWAATRDRPGVNLLENLSESTAQRVANRMQKLRRPRQVMIASIHWGGNWGYDVPGEQIAFAHRLVGEGFDIVHGHSSHHVKPIEVFKDRLILYGCGDFITDYEGISGYEAFRGDLALMYLVQVDPRNGQLVGVRLVPFQMRRFRLEHASPTDAAWLYTLLNRLGEPFSTQFQLANDNSIKLVWR